MRASAVIALGGALLLGGIATHLVVAEPIPATRGPAPIVFVCRNGVAMSVWAAAYFNRLASAHDLRERAIARAVVPSFTAVPLNMAVALAIDGFRLDGYRPKVISPDDAGNADLVVAIDTDLPSEMRPRVAQTEVWQGFPPMREQYFLSRRAIKARVEALVGRLAAARSADPVVNRAQ